MGNRSWIVLAVLSAAALLAGCGAPPPSAPAPTSTAPAAIVIPDGVVRFVVLGDFGMGNDDQAKVADAIKAVCAAKGCQFAITVGDNIYPSGVSSPYDEQFNEKFEQPYADLDFPFYLVLGNHDNGDGAGSKAAVGDYQVAYSRRTDRASEKWNMPARNYNFTRSNVEFFALDSGPQEVSQNPIWLPGGRGSVMEEWIATRLAASTATWKFAFAHHPYISNGPHGNAGLYDNIPSRGLAYLQMLEDHVCGNVQIYFAGHDHHMQWLKPVAACGGTEFIISGAGGAEIYDQGLPPHNDAYFEDYVHHGFLWAEVDRETFTGVFFDAEGNAMFERKLMAT